MPKVSIIVPVHNPGKYLTPCLNSLINQTFKDIEILLIDDGSTDGSRQILKEYELKDSRIKVFFRDPAPFENFSEKYSIDLGRQYATGLYVMFIDHDDELMLDAIEKLYSYSQNNTIDVIQGRSISINENNDLVGSTPNLFSQPIIFNQLETLKFEDAWKHAVINPIQLWTCLIRREFQQNIELDDCVYNDSGFIWKLKVLAQSYCYIPKYIHIYNEHKDSVSGIENINKYQLALFDMFSNLAYFLKIHNVNSYVWTLYAMFEFRILLDHFDKRLNNNLYKIFGQQFQNELQKNIDISSFLDEETQIIYNNIKNKGVY